jgi:hypothetical protein
VCSEVVRYFVKEHLSLMAQRVAEALEAVGPPFLVQAGKALFQRVGEAPRQPDIAMPGAATAEEELLQCGLSGDATETLIQLSAKERSYGRA